jgi:carboxymethylenebutenolidase
VHQGARTQDERRADLIAGISYLETLPFVQANRIGTVGFCAGGGNVWDLAVNVEELAAAVAFYGITEHKHSSGEVVSVAHVGCNLAV